MAQTTLARVLYLPHGAGPMPLLGNDQHQHMVSFLQDVTQCITKPDAILVVSAHWEKSIATLTSDKQPELIYDYYGFSPEAYTIQYPAVGNAQLAEEIGALIIVTWA